MSNPKKPGAAQTVTLKAIRRLAAQIAKAFCPNRIILFGSYAAGKPTLDSDVDLLVVMDTPEAPIHTAARISAAVEHLFPLDILVLRPADLDASRKRRGSFATEVSTKGLVLYEA
jgi:uncharacterized protein